MLTVKLALKLQLGLPFCIYYVSTKPNSTLLMRYSYCHVGWHINIKVFKHRDAQAYL